MSSSSKVLLVAAAAVISVCLVLAGVVLSATTSPQVLILAGAAVLMLIGASAAFIASARREQARNDPQELKASPFAPARYKATSPDAAPAYPRPSSSVTASVALPGTVFMPKANKAPAHSPAQPASATQGRARAPMFDPEPQSPSLYTEHHTPTPRALPNDATHHTPLPASMPGVGHAPPRPVPVTASTPWSAEPAATAHRSAAAVQPGPMPMPAPVNHFGLMSSGELSQEILSGLLDVPEANAQSAVSRADLSKGIGPLAAVDPTRKLDPGSQHRLRHASSMDDNLPEHGVALDEEGMPSVFSGLFSVSGESQIPQSDFNVQDEVEHLRRVIQADEDAHAENLDAFRSQVPGLTD